MKLVGHHTEGGKNFFKVQYETYDRVRNAFGDPHYFYWCDTLERVPKKTEDEMILWVKLKCPGASFIVEKVCCNLDDLPPTWDSETKTSKYDAPEGWIPEVVEHRPWIFYIFDMQQWIASKVEAMLDFTWSKEKQYKLSKAKFRALMDGFEKGQYYRVYDDTSL